MSFREKMLWVAITAMGLGFGFYFVTLLSPIGENATADYYVGLLLSIIGITIGAMLIATLLLFLRDRSEVHFTEDERDRDIHKSGTQMAYYPLLLGVWGAGILYHHGVSTPTMLNALLAVIVSAEMIRLGYQIYLYRKA